MRNILLIASIACFFSAKAQDIDVLHYKFVIDLNDTNDSIKGLAAVTLINKGTKPTIQLDLASVNKQGRGMEAYFISLDDQASKRLSFFQTGNKLQINTQLQKNDTTTIYIAYRGIPADGLIISKNKFGDRTFFADNWPNRAHHWLPCNDRPDDKATLEFRVTAPVHYLVVSNGIPDGEKILGNGFKRTSWKEATPLSTKMMVIGVARFATKTYADSPSTIPVSAWFYPQDSAKGFYDYAVAPAILKFFADYVGPFPYKKLANVQSKTIFGGMENASAIFYNEDYVTGKRQHEDVIAHEIAHQWFGDMVSEKSFAHLWLSEGFADYFERYYFEKKYGENVAREKWIDARDEVIEFAKQSSKPVVDSTEDLMSLLNANSYKKGAWFLRMLRYEVGDSAFKKIIRIFYDQYKGGNAETSDFEAVAEKVTGKEMTWFFNQWLYRPGIPKLQISGRFQGNELTLYVKQLGRAFQFNLDVDVITQNREHMRKQIYVDSNETMYKIPVNGTSAKFSIDPEAKLLFEEVKQ